MNTTQSTAGGRRRLLASFLAAGLVLAGFTACTTTHQVSQSDKDFSGFLGDYSELKPGKDGQANFLYINQAAPWKTYTQVYVKPVQLWKSADPASPLGSLSPDDQQMLVNTLHTAVASALGKDFPLASQPGPGVLVVSVAITDAGTSMPVINLVSTILPVGWVINGAKTVITGKGAGVGAVSIEAAFTDGQTGQRVAAIVDERAGGKALRTKFDGTWGDVKLAFDWWANQADARLLELKSGGVIQQ